MLRISALQLQRKSRSPPQAARKMIPSARREVGEKAGETGFGGIQSSGGRSRTVFCLCLGSTLDQHTIGRAGEDPAVVVHFGTNDTVQGK